jgi:phage-related protein
VQLDILRFPPFKRRLRNKWNSFYSAKFFALPDLTSVSFLIHCLADEWLKALPKEDCKVIGADILTVQYAWPVGKPLVDNLGEGIWEVRSRLDNRIARTLFAMVSQEIVLLHGFIKKQQRTPQDELELARKRKRQYLQNL